MNIQHLTCVSKFIFKISLFLKVGSLKGKQSQKDTFLIKSAISKLDCSTIKWIQETFTYKYILVTFVRKTSMNYETC